MSEYRARAGWLVQVSRGEVRRVRALPGPGGHLYAGELGGRLFVLEAWTVDGDREWSVHVFDPETLTPRPPIHIDDDVTLRVDGAGRLFAQFPSGRGEAWDLRDGRGLGRLPAPPDALDLLPHLSAFGHHSAR